MVLREDLKNADNLDKFIKVSKNYNKLSDEQRNIVDNIRNTLTLQELMYVVENSK